MSGAEFNASIRSAYHFLKQADVARTFMHFKSHTASAEFRSLVFGAESRYREIYLVGLRNSDYNVLLNDFSYLQFTFFSASHYRCAFYPNPFLCSISEISAFDEALDEGVASFEEYSHLLSDMHYSITKPLIRFELDLQAYVALEHPSAHFHIGMHNENRWPASRCLTPKGFALLVAKLYYPEAWSKDAVLRAAFDRYLTSEKQLCLALPPDVFRDEASQFYFA